MADGSGAAQLLARLPARPRLLLATANGTNPHEIDEWHEVRRLGIGGSDIGSVLGLNPWRSAFEVYLEKTGEHDGRASSEPAEWGRRLEPIIATWAGMTMDAGLVDSPGILGSATHPFMLASVDRFVERDAELAVLECKLTRWPAGWADDEIPEAFEAQARWYLLVTGLEVAHIAVLIGGTSAELRRVERNDRIERYLVERAEAFWDAVERRDPPMPGTSRGDARVLNAIRADPALTVELDEEWRDRLGALVAVKRHQDRLKTAREQLENLLKAALGPATEGWLDGERVVTWKTRRGSVEWSRLVKEHPELAPLGEHYRKPATRVLNPTFNPEERP